VGTEATLGAGDPRRAILRLGPRSQRPEWSALDELEASKAHKRPRDGERKQGAIFANCMRLLSAINNHWRTAASWQPKVIAIASRSAERGDAKVGTRRQAAL
jgi:hypothetical protein